jgi:uncharacterized protein
MITRRLLLVCMALIAAVPGLAQKAPDHVALAQKLVADYLLPKTKAFEQAAQAQAAAWGEACQGMDQSRVDGLQGHFSTVATAYAAVEIIRFGPLSEESRAERILHWPERKNAIAKGMADLLKRGNGLDDARLKEASAAAQGLSALERLLFEPDFQRRLSDVDGPPIASLKDVDRALLCAYGQTLSLRIATQAHDIARAWSDPNSPTRQPLATPDGAKAMIARVTTDLLSALELIKDKKLKAALGAAPGEEKPALLEMWRSGQTMRQIAGNLAGIGSVTRLLVQDGSKTADDGIASTQRVMEPLMDRMPRELPLTERSKFILIANLVDTIQIDLKERLPAALGVTAGFNSNDGD